MEPLNLLSFPEELLERILSYCVVAHTSQPPRPSWHRPSGSSPTPAPTRGRLAILLVSKTFLRISTPLYYHTVLITSPSQLHRLLHNALRPNADLAGYIRRLVLAGIWAEGGELLQLCNTRLEMLDVVLDTTLLAPGVPGQVRDLDAEEFCDGLKDVSSLKYIVVRKPGNVYLTQPRPRYVLSEIAAAMDSWNDVEHVDLAFRVSDDSSGRTPPGPITALTSALSTRPKLHTLSTMLPSVWNESMLRVSANPTLERIILGDGASHSRNTTWSGRDFNAAPVSATSPPGPTFEGTCGIPSTGLFFLQAKKHPRLCELIRAGTYIIRTRAQTMGRDMHMSSPPFASVSQSTSPAQGAQSFPRARSQSHGAMPHPPSAPSAQCASTSAKPHLPHVVEGRPWGAPSFPEASSSSSPASRSTSQPAMCTENESTSSC